MFIWGWGTKLIGSTLTNVECSHCKKNNLFLAVYQKFFDVFFVPTIPLDKCYILACAECEMQLPLNKSDLDKDILMKVKTPLWGFSGLFIILFLGVLITVFSYFGPKKKEIHVSDLKIEDTVVIKINDEDEFPFTVIKVLSLDDHTIKFIPGNYSYSKLYQASKAARNNIQKNYSDEVYELPLGEFKKLSIEYVQHQHK